MAHKDKWCILFVNIQNFVINFTIWRLNKLHFDWFGCWKWTLCANKWAYKISARRAGGQATANDADGASGIYGRWVTDYRLARHPFGRPNIRRILFTNAPHPSWKCLLTRMSRYNVIFVQHRIYVCLRYCKYLIYSLCDFKVVLIQYYFWKTKYLCYLSLYRSSLVVWGLPPFMQRIVGSNRSPYLHRTGATFTSTPSHFPPKELSSLAL